jgi:hypothetical protein
MASVARSIGRNVLYGLGGSTAWISLSMAGRAVFRRAFKDAVNVASFAPDNFMRPTKCETCTQVVKRGTWLLGMCYNYRAELKNNNQSKRNCDTQAHGNPSHHRNGST